MTVTRSKLSGKTSKFSCPILGQSINRVRGADGIHSRTSTRNHIHSSGTGTGTVTRENRQLLQGCSDNMQPDQLPLDSVSWRLYDKTAVVPHSTAVCLLSVYSPGRVYCRVASAAILDCQKPNARRPRILSHQAPPLLGQLYKQRDFYLDQESQEGGNCLNLGPVLCFG